MRGVFLSYAARPKRRFGQNFLTCRDVAAAEARFAIGRNAIELGPGRGMLTRELCSVAERVLAVEIDSTLSGSYSGNEGNLRLINADFFELGDREFDGYDILVSNVPYNMSSRTLDWVFSHGMEAVLCLQKEFAGRMAAKAGTSGYSRLSVFCALAFGVSIERRVKASCFSPRPKVDSCVVRMLPNGRKLDPDAMRVISLLMEHKKKGLGTALEDSREGLGIDRKAAREISEGLSPGNEKVFRIGPEELLGVATAIAAMIRTHKREP